MSFPLLQLWNSCEINSGPLSQRMLFGFPFSQMISSIKRIRRDAGMEWATFCATATRSLSSMTLNTRNLRLLCKTSVTKSMDHVTFSWVGVTSEFHGEAILADQAKNIRKTLIFNTTKVRASFLKELSLYHLH